MPGSRSLDAAERAEVEVFACGPHGMLVAVAALARRHGVPCQVSLEENMACGVGGCAGCTVLVQTPDGPAMKRVCVDGPVFDARHGVRRRSGPRVRRRDTPLASTELARSGSRRHARCSDCAAAHRPRDALAATAARRFAHASSAGRVPSERMKFRRERGSDRRESRAGTAAQPKLIRASRLVRESALLSASSMSIRPSL